MAASVFTPEFKKLASEVNWNYLVDLNQSSYSQNVIQFDTQPIINQVIVPSEMYVEIPIVINFSAAPGAATPIPPLSYRLGCLGWIDNMNVELNDVTVFSPPGGLSVYNDIHLRLSKSQNWAQYQQSLYQWAADSGVVGSNSTAGSNNGLLARENFLASQSVYTWVSSSSASLQTRLRIPLADVCDVFKKLNFPVSNLRMRFTMTLSISSSAVAIQGGVAPLELEAGAFTISSVAIAPVQSSVLGPLDKCRVYYRSFKFSGEAQVALAKAFTSGEVLQENFIEPRYYKGDSASTSSSVNTLITPAVTRPVRMTTVLNTSSVGSYGSVSASNALLGVSAFPVAYQGKMTQMNLIVNGRQFFNQNLISLYDFWNETTKQVFAESEDDQAGALLAFQDFCSGQYSAYVFDLTKYKEIFTDPNASLQIYLQSNRADGTSSMNYHHFVDTQKLLSISLSSSGVSVLVGLPN